MKWIKLAGAAYVNGVLRHPHEGVLHLEDDEAKRLLDDKLGEDVSGDFDAKQDKAPAESVTVASGGEAAPEADHPHQSEIAPAVTEQTKPARASRAAEKE